MKERSSSDRSLIISFALFVLLVFALLCTQEGDAHRIVVPFDQATDTQVEEAVEELGELMKAAGRSPQQIAEAQHDLLCAYRPDTEGCDEVHRDH